MIFAFDDWFMTFIRNFFQREKFSNTETFYIENIHFSIQQILSIPKFTILFIFLFPFGDPESPLWISCIKISQWYTAKEKYNYFKYFRIYIFSFFFHVQCLIKISNYITRYHSFSIFESSSLLFLHLLFTLLSELFEVSALKISISTKAQTEWTIQRLSEENEDSWGGVFVWIIRECSFLSLGREGKVGFRMKNRESLILRRRGFLKSEHR